MVAVNVPKLRGKMTEKGYNVQSFASAVKISRVTLNKYLNFPNKMPFEVVSQMADLLCDSPEEVMSIFFDENYHIVKVQGGDQ